MTQDTSSSSFWGGGKGHDLLVEVAEPIYRSLTSMAHWGNFFNFFETARGLRASLIKFSVSLSPYCTSYSDSDTYCCDFCC